MRLALSRFALAVLAGAVVMPVAFAKLPPLSDDAKAKAGEAAAKAAHGNKVADFQLCKSMDKAAVKYFATMKAAGKEAKPPADMPPCADPGPFVAAPAAAAAPAASAPASAAVPKKS